MFSLFAPVIVARFVTRLIDVVPSHPAPDHRSRQVCRVTDDSALPLWRDFDFVEMLLTENISMHPLPTPYPYPYPSFLPAGTTWWPDHG